MHALARTLVPLIEPETTSINRLKKVDELCEYLMKGPDRLRNVVEEVINLQPGTTRLFLLVDQWEELYTLNSSSQERKQFIDLLLDASMNGLLTVVLTMRGDFFGHLLAYRPVADLLQDAVINIGPMTREELRAVIEAPARQVGLEFAPGLADRILDDVNDEPGNLPLLEFVLTELWEHRQGRHLLHEAYNDMGQIQGAITERAETVFVQSCPEEQQYMRRLFLQLVRPGAGTEDTRRRIPLSQLRSDTYRELILRLSDNRLLVTTRDELDGKETAEVSHEALIKSWRRLREWVNQDREFLLWLQRLRIAIKDWEHNLRDSGALLRGAPLSEAVNWFESRPDEISADLQEFIKSSIALRNEELRSKQRLRRKITSGLVVGIILALALAGIVGYQWRQAEFNVSLAIVQSAAVNAEQIQERHPELLSRSILLAAESARRAIELKHPLLITDQALRKSIRKVPTLIGFRNQTFMANTAIYSVSGKYFVTNEGCPVAVESRCSASFYVWDANTSHLVNKIQSEGHVVSASFSMNGNRVAIVEHSHEYYESLFKPIKKAEKEQVIGDIEQLEEVDKNISVSVRQIPHGQIIYKELFKYAPPCIALSSDGKCLAIGGEYLTLVNLDTGKKTRLSKFEKLFNIDFLMFSPDMHYLVMIVDSCPMYSETCKVKLLAIDLKLNSKIWDMKLDKQFISPIIQFSRDSKTLALAETDYRNDRYILKLLDAKRGDKIKELVFAGQIEDMEFSQDSGLLALAIGTTAQVWDIRAGKKLGTMQHKSSVNSVSFHPQGRLVASTSFEDAVYIWDVKTAEVNRRIPADETVFSLRFDETGNKLFMAGGSVWENTGEISLWQINNVSELYHPINSFDLYSTAISKDAQYGVSALLNDNETVIVWRLLDGEEVARFKINDKVEAVTISNDNQLIAAGTRDKVYVWRLESKELIFTAEGLNWLDCLAFSTHHRFLATGDGGPADDTGDLKIWDIGSCTLVDSMKHGGEVVAIAFSPDGKYIATGSRDWQARIWDRETQKEFKRFPHNNWVATVAFSEDGKLLVTGGAGPRSDQKGEARIYDVMSGTELARVEHERGVVAAIFSPDETKLATGGWDQTARIWDWRAKREISRMSHNSSVSYIVFQDEDEQIVSIGHDGIRRWYWRLGRLYEEACARVTRNLTEEEWHQYIGNEPYQCTCPANDER